MFFQADEHQEETQEVVTEVQQKSSTALQPEFPSSQDFSSAKDFTETKDIKDYSDTVYTDYQTSDKDDQYTDYVDTYDVLFEPNGPRTLEEAKLPFGFGFKGWYFVPMLVI